MPAPKHGLRVPFHGRYVHKPMGNVAADCRNTGAGFKLRCDDIVNLPDGHAIWLLLLGVK